MTAIEVFPPDIAKRKLAKSCEARGHKADPVYRAGTHPALKGTHS